MVEAQQGADESWQQIMRSHPVYVNVETMGKLRELERQSAEVSSTT